jgi:hypothetical protein
VKSQNRDFIFSDISLSPLSGKKTKTDLMLRKFKVAVVVRTLVRLHPLRTEVRATLKKLPKT